MFRVMEFSGIVKDQERKVEKKNGMIKISKAVRRMIIKFFTMKTHKIKINKCKS